MTDAPEVTVLMWTWYCRLCGASDATVTEASRDTAAFAHVDACPSGRGLIVATDCAGRLRHVWSHSAGIVR